MKLYHRIILFLLFSVNFAAALENYLDAIQNLQQHSHEKVYEFFNENRGSVKSDFLLKWVTTLSTSKRHLSLKSEHPEWFEGILNFFF